MTETNQSECRKLVQKVYKTRHDWVEKVIHWELCKKLKFDHTNKWHIHNPESIMENKTQKLLGGFLDSNGSPNLSQMTRSRDSQQQKKENLPNSRLCHSCWPQSETERKRKEKPCKRNENTMEHESDGYTNCNWWDRYSHQRIKKGKLEDE